MIVVAGLVLAFVLILIFSNPATRACRWREDRTGGPGDGEGARRFRCMACGAEALTRTGKPPAECRADTLPPRS